MCLTTQAVEGGQLPVFTADAGGEHVAAQEQEAESSSVARSEPRTGPISGYMDFHYNNPQNEDPILDFHRFVLLFSHSFSDRIRFVAELELEHVVVSDETDGELELEQAYVDFLISRPFNVRAGMVLAPVGIINERHEPPVFHGVERPFVDTVIVPSTWSDAGGGCTWRARKRVPLSCLCDGAARRCRVQRRPKVCAAGDRRARSRTLVISPEQDASSTSAHPDSSSGPPSGVAIPVSASLASTRASR